MDYHSVPAKEVITFVNSNRNGLSLKDANERLEKYGPNRLKKTRKFNALKVFLGEFKSFLVIILILAAIIAALMHSKVDAIVIGVIVIVNALIGFYQEYKAERAIDALKKMMVPKATVIRNGKTVEINSELVVPGDILILNEGDKIIADARVLSNDGLSVNEASLTGESVADNKFDSVLQVNTPLADRTNMVYQGTIVVSGSGIAVVIATGMNTELGNISKLVQEVKSETNPLKEKLDKFAQKIGLIIIAISAIIVGLMIFTGSSVFQSFLIAVSLAVSAIPEGLPAVISIGLAFATKRMLKNKVLVRKLPASETLGRTTVICTDKTGTLTEEKMKVVSVYSNGSMQNTNHNLLLKTGVLCNKAVLEKDESGHEYSVGDPTEIALLLSAKENFLDKNELEKNEPKVKEFPFSSERKMMSIVRQNGNKMISYVKGAPEKIIALSNYELVNNRKVKLTLEKKKQIVLIFEEMAKKGQRVLGFAYKDVKEAKIESAESDLIFIGLQGMIDPPRKEVRGAISLCKQAGIKVLMITGDSKLTATAIAHEIGLNGESIDSVELNSMSDEELDKLIDKVCVFSRISPESKLRIINILKKRNEVVAMTGDGVNDALALKRADIGISMGIRGTEVARDSSDIVLLDDNFASIVSGVKEGRRVYDNIKKFIKYLFAANFYEVALVLSVILIWRNPELLPLLPLQILWINLVTDSFPALSLSAEEIEPDAMRRKPGKAGILNGTGGFILLAGIIGFIITMSVFLITLDFNDIEGTISRARTLTLVSSVVYQMFLVFNCKSKELFFKGKFNPYILYAVVGVMILQVTAIYWQPLAGLFSFTTLSLIDWGICAGFAFVGFLIIELTKIFAKKLHS